MNDTTQEAHSEVREKWWLKNALKFGSSKYCLINSITSELR